MLPRLCRPVSRRCGLHPLVAFAIVVAMGIAASGQPLPAPGAVTNPARLRSATVNNMQQFSLPALVSTRYVGGSSWSPDGKRVVFVSNISGRNNLWTIPARGGWPTQLTLSRQRQAAPAWSPDGKWIAFQSDRNGDELWDIYLVSPLTGEVTDLSAIPDSAEEFPAWSPDSKYVAYMVKAKRSPSFEIEYIDIATRISTRVTHKTPPRLSNIRPLWSPDGTCIAYTQQSAGGADSNIFLYDVAKHSAVKLTPHTGEETFSAAEFSPDGKSLVVTSNAAHGAMRGGYDNVAVLDIANRRLHWITRSHSPMQAGGFSPDGKRVYWTADIDGQQSIESRAVAGGPIERLPLPGGVNGFGGSPTPLSRDGRLLYEHSNATSPNDLYVFTPGASRSKAAHSTQLTHSLVAGVSPASMVSATLVHFPSRDGKFVLSAWAYVPNNIIRNGSYPAIVYLHGGPAAQSKDGFQSFIQYMCNQGYLVIAPNYRGSSGYGTAFRQASRHDAGGEDLNDVVASAAFLRRSGFVDPKKLTVMGSGYGGYLAMMAVAKEPSMWAAGVAIAPFVNWFSEFANEDPARREYDRRFMGDPAKDKALWMDRSPVHFADKIKAPLLLLAGANDRRFPPSEAEQLAAAVKKHGGVAMLKIYQNEGHGFSRLKNRIDAYQHVADFLRVHVPSPGCGCGI